jgi:hypothetical protein
MINYISFGDVQYNHEVDNLDCQECWSGYPKPCKCGGLIHAQFGDENLDGDYWLFKHCDKCGDSYEEI